MIGWRPDLVLLWWLYLIQQKLHTAKNDQKRVNSFEHKIHTFYIHWWVIYQRQSHPIIQFISVRYSKKCPKFLASVFLSCSPKFTLSIPIYQLVHFWLIYMDNVILEDPVWYHLPCINISVIPKTSHDFLLWQPENITVTPSSITIITFLFLMVSLLLEAHIAVLFSPVPWRQITLQLGSVLIQIRVANLSTDLYQNRPKL